MVISELWRGCLTDSAKLALNNLLKVKIFLDKFAASTIIKIDVKKLCKGYQCNSLFKNIYPHSKPRGG